MSFALLAALLALAWDVNASLCSVIHERSDEAAWEAQREAQRRLTVEERLLQNDDLSRLVNAAQDERDQRRIG